MCDPAKLPRARQSAAEAGRRWTFEDHYRQLLAVFEEVVARKRAASARRLSPHAPRHPRPRRVLPDRGHPVRLAHRPVPAASTSLQAGSGNIGATNVGRVLGRKFGLLVFALDFAKGAGAGRTCRGSCRPKLTTHSACRTHFASGPALCAFLGHMFPIYLRFRGGKGVATGAGTVFVLVPGPTALALLTLDRRRRREPDRLAWFHRRRRHAVRRAVAFGRRPVRSRINRGHGFLPRRVAAA